MAIYILITAIAGLIVGAVGAYFFIASQATGKLQLAKTEADRMRETAKLEAENKAKEIELSAKQQQLKMREEFEKETEGERRKLADLENRLNKREDTLDRKLDTLSVKEKNLDDLEIKLSKRDKSSAAKEQELEKGFLKEQRERHCCNWRI